MLKLAWIVTFAGLMCTPVLAQTPAKAPFPTFAAPGRGRVNRSCSARERTHIMGALRVRMRYGSPADHSR